MKKESKRESQKVMRLNRFFSDRRTVIALCILEDIFVFLVLTYIINVCGNFDQWLNDLDHPMRYIGIGNVLPRPGRIAGNPGLLWFYLLAVLLCIFLNAVLVYQIHTSLGEKNFNIGQRGVARWTTNEEIKEQYKEIPDRNKTFAGAGGTIISRIGDKLYIDDTMTNNLIIGITRSGKGEMFVLPSIDVYSRAQEKTSMVISDPKMELYKASKKTLEERGYEVYLLNLDDPLHSMGFNPLEQIKEEYLKKNYAEAELLAQAFSYSIFNPDKATGEETFWQDTASSLLTALILAHIQDCIKEDELENERRLREWKKKKAAGDPAAGEFVYTHENEKKINMYSIINTFQELARIKNEDNPDITALDSYFSERPMLDRAKMKYSTVEISGDRTKGSIFATMMSKLTIFTFENFAKMTAESTLKLEDVGFGEKPVAVFLGIPDYDKSSHFMATAFIRQLIFVLEKIATRGRSGKCRNKVRCILDEFGNLPAIEGMESFITVCLGRNIAFDLYIQAYAQMQKLYGDNAETIEGNCGNQIYILTNSENTAEKYSGLLGNQTIVDVQRSGEKMSLHKHFTETMIDKPLLNKNELMELEPGECVIKRVMKRHDLKGQRIRPTPIFNSEESGKRMLFRWEYLTDTFPDPDTIDLYEVNKEDRSHIDHIKRVWDYKRSFEQMIRASAPDTVQRLNMLYNEQDIRKLLKELLSQAEYEQIYGDMPVSRLIDIVNQSSMKRQDKDAIVNLIEFSAA